MVLKVPRLSLINGQLYDDDGVRFCSRCAKRPAGKVARGRKLRWTWCNVCRAEVNRDRRQGKIQTLVTPEEYALLREWRAELKLAEFDQDRKPARHRAEAGAAR